MRSPRHKRHDIARRVEDLEGRVVLSGFGAFGAWQGMMRGAVHAAPAQVQPAAPASPFQYAQSPARSFGSGVATWQGVNPTHPGRAAGAINFNPVVNTTPPTWNIAVSYQTRPYSNFAAMRTNLPNSQNSPAPPMNSVTPTNPTTTPPPTTSATAPPAAPLPPNAGGALNTLYQGYTAFAVDNPNADYYPPSYLGLTVVNNEVAVYVNGNGAGDFASFVSSLEGLGMNVSATNAVTWTVSGMLPIGELPAVATNAQTLSIAPRYGFTTQGSMRF